MLKRLIIVSIISVFMLSAFTLNPKDSKAATLPPILFTDTAELYASVADLGTIFGNEWEIVIYNDFPIGATPFGFGFRNYNTTYNTAEQTVFEDDNWYGYAMVFTWVGDGTQSYISTTNGFQGVETLTTTPPPAPAASVDSVFNKIKHK